MVLGPGPAVAVAAISSLIPVYKYVSYRAPKSIPPLLTSRTPIGVCSSRPASGRSGFPSALSILHRAPINQIFGIYTHSIFYIHPHLPPIPILYKMMSFAQVAKRQAVSVARQQIAQRCKSSKALQSSAGIAQALDSRVYSKCHDVYTCAMPHHKVVIHRTS